jgi:hypothetical protein
MACNISADQAYIPLVDDSWMFIEGSLEVKVPTILTDEKQRGEESERREE